MICGADVCDAVRCGVDPGDVGERLRREEGNVKSAKSLMRRETRAMREERRNRSLNRIKPARKGEEEEEMVGQTALSIYKGVTLEE